MRNVTLLICFCILILGCSTNKAAKSYSRCECTKEKILEIAEKKVKSIRSDFDLLERKITEEEDCFFVQYIPSRRALRVDLRISKETCEIIYIDQL